MATGVTFDESDLRRLAPWSFLKIAETYRKYGDRKLATQWVQKGINAFPKSPDKRLRDFLAEECQHTGRP